MQPQVYPVSASLRPWITRYIHIMAEGSTDCMPVPNDPTRFRNGKHVQPVLPCFGFLLIVKSGKVALDDVPMTAPVVACPPSMQFHTITTLEGWFEGIAVVFAPGAYSAFRMTDEILYEQSSWLNTGATITENIAHIETFLQTHFVPEQGAQVERLFPLFRRVEEVQGAISVQDLVLQAHLCERQLRRMFQNTVGMSPKDFIRMQRFHGVIQHLYTQAASGEVDYLSVALQHGYTDLSHMAADFRHFGCTTPSRFQALGIPISADFSYFFR